MQVVLVNPQIPQNTGSIARTCAATNCPLHLVGSLGFQIDERRVRRAGLDYWPHVQLSQHATWEDYLQQSQASKIWLFSTHAAINYTEADIGPDDALVFGSETSGLGQEFLSRYPTEQRLIIPMKTEHVRSLNLSNAVSIVLYHALQKLNYFSNDFEKSKK